MIISSNGLYILNYDMLSLFEKEKQKNEKRRRQIK